MKLRMGSMLRKFTVGFILMTGSFLLLSKPAEAFEVKAGEAVTVPEGQVVEGSIVAVGQQVRINGEVHGDIFCAGQDVVISGFVDGDVLCAAQTMRLSGDVSGNARIMGQSVILDALINRNVTAFSQTFRQSDASETGGEALVAGQSLEFSGDTRKDLTVFAEDVVISGAVGGNLKADVGSLTIDNTAVIAGNVSYTSKKHLVMGEGAKVGGEIKENLIPEDAGRTLERKTQPRTRDAADWIRGRLTGILIFLGLGLLLSVIMPGFAMSISERIEREPVVVLGTGFLVMFFAPLTVLILLVTIIGIPVAFLVLALWIAGLIAARVFVAVVIGRLLLTRMASDKAKSLPFCLIAGVPVLWLSFGLPFIGGLLSFMAMLAGLGGVTRVMVARREGIKTK